MSENFNYKLDLAYDGTNYNGWQVQPDPKVKSIQEIIENAIEIAIRSKVRLIGSGRTDAGVHALGQVAHFKSEKKIDLYRFFRSINGIIPHDIRLLKVESVPLWFHAQKSALRKIYHYNICLKPVVLPFERNYTYHLREPIDHTLLEQACELFKGTHDFTSFTNSAHTGACSKNPVRTIYRIDCIPTKEGIRLEFEANGFLYKMVRNIVGTLIDIATKKRPISVIPYIFSQKNRKYASQAASAQGLFLYEVIYPEIADG